MQQHRLYPVRFFGTRLYTQSDRYIRHVDEPPIINVTKLRQNVSQQLEHNRQTQNEYFNRKRRKATTYQVGDYVLVRITSLPSVGHSRKLCEKFKGPFVILEKLSHDRYRVKELPGSNRLRINTRYEGIVGVENLKQFIARNDS